MCKESEGNAKERERKMKEDLHKRIMDAFNEVPKFEGFTTKDLKDRINMPEPKKRMHLD